MRDINIKAEDIDIINTVLTNEEKEVLLTKLEQARLLTSFNKDKSKL